MFGGQFQLKVQKSDMRNINKCLPLRMRLSRKNRGDTSIYQQIKKSHYNNCFIKLACSASPVARSINLQKKKELNQYKPHASSTNPAI